MVALFPAATSVSSIVSVLALSSRFDGLWIADALLSRQDSFSTRSVESF